MELTTDIFLKGTAWNKAIDNLKNIFTPRTNYDIYMLCLAIGIMYDQRIEKPEEAGEDSKNVPRNVLNNNDNGKLDFMFQACILSTRTEEFTEEERLELAFGEKKDFKKLSFLTQFANYGVTKLVEKIGTSDLESMDQIKDFLFASVDGRNLEINPLSEEIF